MKIINGKIFVGEEFIDGGMEFTDTITAVGENVTGKDDVIDADGNYVIPGLIDIHTHGALGEDASDGNPDGLIKMSRHYAGEGVTSWCPTTMTLFEDTLKTAVEAIRNYKRPSDGAKICGIHMEGPFINESKKGAQNPECIRKPDAAMFRRLNEASGNLIKIITMAPEEEGSMEFIEEICGETTVSLGHTTANYDVASKAYASGAKHATHLYNAMPSLLHRDPGVIAAAHEADATVELITDKIHVHPSVIKITYELFGKNLCLVSDSLRCAGMPDGDYTLGGLPITMKGGKATLTGTDTIAGSSIHLMEGLRRFVSCGIPLEAGVYAATAAPAKAIGMYDTIGSLSPGKAADFVILDKELNVKAVYIDGGKVK